MIGGEKEVVDALRPLFETMGKTIVHQGPAGAGQHTKMVNQILIASNMIGVCEALLYGFKAGLDLNVVLQSVSSGAAGSWSLNNLGPRMIAGNFEPGFFVEHFLKDMGIALAESRRMKLSLPGLGPGRTALSSGRGPGLRSQGYPRPHAGPCHLSRCGLENSAQLSDQIVSRAAPEKDPDRRPICLETSWAIPYRISVSVPVDRFLPFRSSCICFCTDPPRGERMASRRRGKGRRKVGRKSAGCAAGFDIARNNAMGSAQTRKPAG